MKRFVLLCFIALIGTSTVLNGQDRAALIRAIGVGDIMAISEYIDDAIELSILEDQSMYSKEEGLIVLSSFFDQHTILKFSKKHAGNNKKSSLTYTIGELITDQGSYRVFVYTDMVGDKIVLKEMSISN